MSLLFRSTARVELQKQKHLGALNDNEKVKKVYFLSPISLRATSTEKKKDWTTLIFFILEESNIFKWY